MAPCTGTERGSGIVGVYGTRAWPAAKYLMYAFWRSWILIVYTAPIWSYLTGGTPAQSPAPATQMYVWSTLVFSVVSIALAVVHRRSRGVLTNRWAMLGVGVLASLGVVLEYAALLAGGPGAVSPLFVAGAVLSGAGTAFVAVRAGMIYARALPATAVANAALSEVAAGLLFFFVIGTLPQVALLVAAGLPLLAAFMAWLDASDPEGAGCDLEPSGESQPHVAPGALGPFVRFMVAVFVLTCVASLVKGMFDSHGAAGLSLESGVLGVTAAVLVSFALSLAASFARSFNFSVVYYPLVLVLAVGVVLVFALGGYNIFAASITVFVYSMFSLFMWCLLSFIARSDYWSSIQVFGWGRGIFALGSLVGHYVGVSMDPFRVFMWCLLSFIARSDYWSSIQVFGWGRGIFALGSLVGHYVGVSMDPFRVADVQPLVVGVVLAFLVVGSGMLIFREGDVRKVVNAAWLGEELRRGAEGAEPSEGASQAVPDAAAPAVGSEGFSADDFALAHNFTSREREVFSLMLEGRDARTIGTTLVISENTAKSHIRSIYAKTGVHTRQEFIDAVRGVGR